MFKDMKNQLFHPLGEPFFLNPYGVESGISALHNLYPGRPMTVKDSFLNQYMIPNEDPEGAKRTFLNSRRDTKEYAQMLNDSVMAGNGGDGNKVLIHSVEDPSAVINDPDLKNAQTLIPETLGDGSPLLEAPKVTSPIIEGYERDENKTKSEDNFDPFITNIIFAFILIFAIIFLVGFVMK